MNPGGIENGLENGNNILLTAKNCGTCTLAYIYILDYGYLAWIMVIREGQAGY